MLAGRGLERALEAAALHARHGLFHRYVQHQFIARAIAQGSPVHIVTGYFAVTSGGRFNAPGGSRTSYVAADPVTAQVEAERITAPYVHVPIAGELQHVLDLTDTTTVERLQLSDAELRAEWRAINAKGRVAPTQRLGRVAYATGRIEAIAYPSLRNPGGICLAVFPERLRAGSFLEVADPAGVIRERIP